MGEILCRESQYVTEEHVTGKRGKSHIFLEHPVKKLISQISRVLRLKIPFLDIQKKLEEFSDF